MTKKLEIVALLIQIHQWNFLEQLNVNHGLEKFIMIGDHNGFHSISHLRATLSNYSFNFSPTFHQLQIDLESIK